MEKYEKWRLIVNTIKMKYLCIGTETKKATRKSEFARNINIWELNRERIDIQEMNNRITKARRIIGCLNDILWNINITRKRKFNVYGTIV